MKRTHWTRVIVAAILSELGVFVALFASFGAYGLATQTPFETFTNSSLGEDIGYYVAAPSGFVMTLLAVLWATRPLTSDIVRHGLLVGLIAVLLTFAFIFGARPDHRLMYVVSFLLRIVGGYTGGVIAERRFASRARVPKVPGVPEVPVVSKRA
jgi:hypothetical protein